jgi:CelD/BcsL family acetyltransferase involved in cellulose biosynthesis
VLVPKLITERSELEAVGTRWDELAVTNRLPLMAPACVMAWWRHLAPPRAEPRTILVHDGPDLVGIAPFYLDLAKPAGRIDLRLPGIELTGRLAPLAVPGREREVADALARALADCEPSLDLLALEGLPHSSPWPAALRASWPGRFTPIVLRYQTQECPTVSLQGGSFEQWMAAKSSNFRGQMRRLRRKFEAAGGTIRASTLETLGSDVDAFMRLHTERWEHRGESQLVSMSDRLPAMLEDLGHSLLGDERFHLIVLEVGGEPISAQLFLTAGGHVLYVNGGWDERFAKLKPSMLGILTMIERAFARGERDVDLGLGSQPYKLRFADDDYRVVWMILMPVGVRLPITGLRTTPMLAQAGLRNALKHRISRERIDRYRGLRSRMRENLSVRSPKNDSVSR